MTRKPKLERIVVISFADTKDGVRTIIRSAWQTPKPYDKPRRYPAPAPIGEDA